jgi:hypothetical protein
LNSPTNRTLYYSALIIKKKKKKNSKQIYPKKKKLSKHWMDSQIFLTGNLDHSTPQLPIKDSMPTVPPPVPLGRIHITTHAITWFT